MVKPSLHPAPQAVVYQIRLKDHLRSEWADWFGGMTITLEEGGQTLLTGPVVDQAALHGILKKVRDLGLSLVSVNRVQSEATHPYHSGKEKDMQTNTKTAVLADVRPHVRLKLSALWIVMMLVYIYADIFSLYKPGVIEAMIGGRMGPFPVTQASLATASILVIIPALMVFLSLVLKSRAARWTNIILGVLYTLVNISNLIGETWAFYILSGFVELAVTLLIIGYAWTWRNQEGQPG